MKRFIAAMTLVIVLVVGGAQQATAQIVDSPSQTPSTTTVPDVPEIPDIENEEDSPGLFDLSGRVGKAIDDWLAGLITSALNPALDLLGKTLLAHFQTTPFQPQD